MGLAVNRGSQHVNNTSDMQLRPLTPHLGAEVLGIDLAQPLAPDVFASLYAAFLRYQVLLFPPMPVPPAAQVAFAKLFGEVQVHVMARYHADGHPELYRLSNLDAQGQPNGKHPDKGTLAWHTDGSSDSLRAAHCGIRLGGGPATHGSASPARPRSFTARWPRASAARRTSATCTVPMND